MEKTHWKKVFNSDYLGACDFDDNKEIKTIIKEVCIKKVKNTDGKEQERNVAYFTDANLKPMILNATNCKVVKKFAKSNYINDWKNIAVQIYVKDDIKAFGEVTEGLRIRETQPSFKKPELTESSKAFPNAVNYYKANGDFKTVEQHYTLSQDIKNLIKSKADENNA